MVSQTPTQCTNSYCWKPETSPGNFLEIRLQIDLSVAMHAPDALPVQSRFNEESRLQKEFQTCHGTSKVYHKVGPYYCWWKKNPAPVDRLVIALFPGFLYILCGARVLPSTVVVNGVKTLLISDRGEGVEHLGHVDREQRMKKVRSCCHHSKKRGCQKHSTIFKRKRR